MTLPSEGAHDLLVAAGYTSGGTGDWGVYVGKRPQSPERCITVYDSVGTTPNPRWLLDYPGLQIIVRGNENDYQAAYNQAVLVKNHLLGLPSQDVNGDRWVHVNMTGELGFTGYDENDRPLWALNFALIIEPAPSPEDNREPL